VPDSLADNIFNYILNRQWLIDDCLWYSISTLGEFVVKIAVPEKVVDRFLWWYRSAEAAI